MSASGALSMSGTDPGVRARPAIALGGQTCRARLKIWPLLVGHRGSEPCDVEALERLIVAAGRFADDVPQAAELDLNPVLVSPGGCAVVDLKLRMAQTSKDINRASLRMLGGAPPVASEPSSEAGHSATMGRRSPQAEGLSYSRKLPEDPPPAFSFLAASAGHGNWRCGNAGQGRDERGAWRFVAREVTLRVAARLLQARDLHAVHDAVRSCGW